MVARKIVPLLAAGVLVVASCAQPEPEPVGVQPVFDKYGGASCPAEYPYASNQSGRQLCLPGCPQGQSGVQTLGAAPGQYTCVPTRECPDGGRAVSAASGQTVCLPPDDGDQPRSPNDPQRG